MSRAQLWEQRRFFGAQLRPVVLRNRVWGKVAGGCHLNRKIDDLLASNGLDIVELEPPIYRGRAPLRTLTKGCAVY